MNKKKMFFDVLGILIGSLVLAVGINVFLVPNEIAAGGVSGIATVLYLTFKIPMSITILAVNAILFAFGFAILGKWELVKSLLGIIFLSVFLESTAFLPKYGEDVLMAAICGGVLSGVGIGITVSRGASTGGSDMLALMICRKLKHLSVATVILAVDSAVILASGFVFSSMTIMLYAALAAFVSSKVNDYIAVYGDNAKQVQIVTDKSAEISEKIIKTIGRGVTGIYTRGMYTGEDRMTVFCVVSKRELYRVTSIVKEIDSEAFVIVGEVREVLGKGFKEIE